jgi:hypothetical protein
MLRAARRACSLWVLLVLVTTLANPQNRAAEALAGPSAQVYVEQAIALYNKGDCVKGIDLLKKAVAVDSRYVRAYSWLGFCYAKLGRNQEAITAFNRVITLAPTSDDARIARVWIGRLQKPSATRPTSPPTPRPSPAAQQAGPVYLATLPAAAGVTEDNRVRQVQLFGVVYQRAIVERRNWWQGRRAIEREWRVVYNLQRRSTRFRALAGVEDGSPPEFAASFEVRADGNTVFDGKPKRAGDVPDNLDLDVTGVLQLELIVRGNDLLHTRDLTVVWADPSVDSRPGPTQPAPASSPGGPQVVPPAAPPGTPAPPAAPPPATPPPGGWLPGWDHATARRAD